MFNPVAYARKLVAEAIPWGLAQPHHAVALLSTGRRIPLPTVVAELLPKVGEDGGVAAMSGGKEALLPGIWAIALRLAESCHGVEIESPDGPLPGMRMTPAGRLLVEVLASGDPRAAAVDVDTCTVWARKP